MQVRASAAFVGRVQELDVLERALSATRAGRGGTVLLAGEAGIGKTRLASELATRARVIGFEVLLGRSLDLVGTELAFQPLAEALRGLGGIGSGGSQRGVFEATLALLSDRAAAVPVLLVLEDLHWADASTLDIVVYLAHNLDARRVLLLATLRADEPASAARLQRLADGVRRSGAGQILELGPLERAELGALLDARAGTLPAAVTNAILTRSQGNPFFAEELLSAVGERDDAELPRGLRDALLTRVSGLDRRAQSLLRVAAAAGRDVSYPLLVAVAALPERDVRESLRAAATRNRLCARRSSPDTRVKSASRRPRGSSASSRSPTALSSASAKNGLPCERVRIAVVTAAGSAPARASSSAASSARSSGPSSRICPAPERRTPSASRRNRAADAGSSARSVANRRTRRGSRLCAR